MTAEVNIAGYAGKYVDDLFNDLQTDVIANVIDAIDVYVGWLVALYLLGLFIMMMAGRKEVAKDGLWTMLKITIFSAIALSNVYIEQMLLGPIDAFLDLVSSAVAGPDGGTVYDVADTVINKSLAVGDQAWQKAGEAGWRDMEIKASWILAGLFAGIGGMLMIAPAAIAIIAMKAIISLLFMISPIFVLAAIFPLTAKYFINWTAAVGNSVWVIILAALIMSVSSLMTSGMMDQMNIDGSMVDKPLVGPWSIIGMVVFMAILFWILIKFIFNMASTLAGGLSLSMPVTSDRLSRGMKNVTAAAGAAPFKAVAKMVGMPFGRRGGNLKGK